MKHGLIILWRDIYPASGATSLRQRFSDLGISLLPSIGILCVLMVVAFIGLFMLSAQQNLETRLAEIKTSPYMAMFGEGFLYIEDRASSHDTKTDLSYWQRLRIGNIPDLSRHTEQHLIDNSVFEDLFPFGWAYLDIQRRDKERLSSIWGMVLPFSDEDIADHSLLEEIQKHLVGKNVSLPDEEAPCIILSERFLKRLGYSHIKEKPEDLWVSLSQEHDWIPLKILVAKRLPYQFSYVLSLEQSRRFETGYYYRKLDNFQICGPEWKENRLKQFKTLLYSNLPVDTIDEPFPRGSKEVLQIWLKNELELKEIMEHTPLKSFQGLYLDLPSRMDEERGEDFSGAIFHLNPVLHEITDLGEELFFIIQEFMKTKGIDVRGELLYALLENQRDKVHLSRLKGIYWWCLFSTGILITIFFSLVLHTRMHRIGTLRMLGVKDGEIIGVNVVEGLVFVVVSFALAVILFAILKYMMEFDLKLVSSGTFLILVSMMIVAEIGIVLPSLFFLRKLQPAEMVTYRN